MKFHLRSYLLFLGLIRSLKLFDAFSNVNDIENYTGYFFEALIHKLFDSPSLTAMSQNRLHVLVGCFTVPLFTVGSTFKVSGGPGYPDPKIKSPRIYLVKMFFDKHQGLSRTIKRFQLLSRP